LTLTLHNLHNNPGRQKTRPGFKVVLAFALLLTSFVSTAQDPEDPIFEQEEPTLFLPVNRLLGDISYRAKYGKRPTEETPENLRIRTHLEYVEQELRTTPVFHLNAMQLENRYRILDLLHTYWNVGQFPQNNHFSNTRIPVFQDQDSNLCAVAYLIKHTAGQEVVNQINMKHKFHYIEMMQEAYILNWISDNGLTVRECAMIQPTYNYRPPTVTVKPPCTDSFEMPIVIHQLYQVDSVAQFIGGEKAFYDFMKQHQKYPKIAQENGIQGTVYISFIIAPNGNVCNITMRKGVSAPLDNEAKRLVELTSGQWNPARRQGQSVYSYYTVPIRFKLY